MSKELINYLKSWFWRVQREQVEPYASYWLNLTKLEPSNPLVYLSMGDSSAQGIGASQPNFGYVGLVASRLQELTDRPVKVINVSQTGATIQNVLDRQLPQVSALRPDLVTVTVGGNDLWRRHVRNGIEDRLRVLVSRLPANSIFGSMPCFGGSFLERRAQSLNQLAVRLCRDHNLIWAPVHNATHAHRYQPKYYAEDWFHPSDAGYHLWFKAIWPSVLEVINEPVLSKAPRPDSHYGKPERDRVKHFEVR